MENDRIPCPLIGTYVVKSVYCPDKTCETCSPRKTTKTKHEKAKEPTLPANKPPIDEACRELRASYARHNDEYSRVMVELADRGADIFAISRALALLPSKRERKTGTYNMDFGSNKRVMKAALDYDRALGNAFDLLTKDLKPFSLDHLNVGLPIVQNAFGQHKTLLETYRYQKLLDTCSDDLKKRLGWTGGAVCHTDDLMHEICNTCPRDAMVSHGALVHLFPPEKLRAMLQKEVRPAKSSDRDLWDECIVMLVDELLENAHYSKTAAWKKTARLLHLRYPENYPDDADLVRQRYVYHTRNNRDRKRTTSTE